MEPLLDHPARELLRKFGLGGHKPGSGSAAAFQGLLSAQLIRTVISLTNEEKRRPQFSQWLPELLRMNSEIEDRVYRELEKWCQEDSVQFDITIKLRTARDAATDPELKDQLAAKALDALVPSTEIPIEIAKLCVELGDFAAFTFDHGFRPVRGDSAVALNGAVSAVAGCLSIIELNLLSFGWDDWTREIRSEAKKLKLAHERLLLTAAKCQNKLEEENQTKLNRSFEYALTDFRSGRWEEVRLSDAGIESLARQIQNVLWLYRDLLWKDDVPGTYLDVLKPDVAIEKILGYQFGLASLGRHVVDDQEFDIAGEIDKERKVVLVSRGFPREVQNFTTAHELGHALLHGGMVLHRDRRMDGSSPQNADFRERQADRFATFFLMPANQVRAVFEELFGMEKFVINDNTVFALGERRVSVFRSNVQNLRGLSRHVANIEHFQGRTFRSMAVIFNVSVGAMAIRLEELSLVEY